MTVTVLVPREEWEMGAIHTARRHKSPTMITPDTPSRRTRATSKIRGCMRQEHGFNANKSYRHGEASRRNITKGIHVAAGVSAHDGIRARGRTCSFNLWAEGTATTARDERHAMIVVATYNSRPSEKLKFLSREQGTGSHSGGRLGEVVIDHKQRCDLLHI